MKLLPTFGAAILAGFLGLTAGQAQADTHLKISGEQAKKLYNYLTGSAVENEGAAGHLYRLGKMLSCRYADADMSNAQGKSIPQHDPRRYACVMKMDHDGFISISHQF